VTADRDRQQAADRALAEDLARVCACHDPAERIAAALADARADADRLRARIENLAAHWTRLAIETDDGYRRTTWRSHADQLRAVLDET
jgi:hypothetical protein